MNKVTIKISQGRVVTEIVVGGLTIHLPVANFLWFIWAKNYENWLRVGKVIAKKAVCSFFRPPCTVLYKCVGCCGCLLNRKTYEGLKTIESKKELNRDDGNAVVNV